MGYTAKQLVLTKYPKAYVYKGRDNNGSTEYQVVVAGFISFSGEILGRGHTEGASWKDAAQRIVVN